MKSFASTTRGASPKGNQVKGIVEQKGKVYQNKKGSKERERRLEDAHEKAARQNKEKKSSDWPRGGFAIGLG
jgi:hypothetical protein